MDKLVDTTRDTALLADEQRELAVNLAGELPNKFFRVRMWDQDDLIDQLLEQFERLLEDLRAELPLKRIWTLAAQDEEE